MPFNSTAKSPRSNVQKGKARAPRQLRRQLLPVATSPRRSSSASSFASGKASSEHIAFLPLLLLTFAMWCVYRVLFRFPVWFDESIGKAVFFGAPVFLYAALTRSRAMAETVDAEHMQSGLWIGLAVGGMFGFVGTLASLMRSGVVIDAMPVFTSQTFWAEYLLAMLTGFWESLFFFGWIMVVILEKWKRWPLINQVLLTTAIFLAFHVPNTLLRVPLGVAGGQLFLLFCFGLGQALLFYRVRNIYALSMSHAIWGMVLLVHTR